MTDDVVKIQQRVQEKGKFLFITADEAVFLIAPIFLGIISRHTVLGMIAGVLLWQAWVFIKGEGGLASLMASAYWWLPKEAPLYRSFPASHVSEWRG